MRVKFTLSPGDIYTANGRVEIRNAPVPEPMSVTLMGIGLGAVAFALRRRART